MLKKSFILISIIFIFLMCIGFENTEEISHYLKNQQELINYYQEKKEKTLDSYYGVLEIPSIHLKRGFFSLESPLNHVDKSIEVISSCNPKETCDFILASHSGDSPISFFKELDKLQINDTANLNYNHEIYTYYLKSIENAIKDGSISLEKSSLSRLILTTCDRQNNSIQKIYIFEKEET